MQLAELLSEVEALPDELVFAALKNALTVKTAPLPGEEAPAAAFALRLGVPELALYWAQLAGAKGAALAAAAALRLGQLETASALIDTLPDTARRAVLYARAGMLGGQWDMAQAEAARDEARREGDAPALIAAVTLLGELQLLMSDMVSNKAKPYAALRTLAEGLKVAELTHQAADAHLLAVLAHAQQRAGSARKAGRTAEKALERSSPRSPARVWALLVLNREAEAEAERLAGQLAAGWFAAYGREARLI